VREPTTQTLAKLLNSMELIQLNQDLHQKKYTAPLDLVLIRSNQFKKSQHLLLDLAIQRSVLCFSHLQCQALETTMCLAQSQICQATLELDQKNTDSFESINLLNN